VTAWQTCSIDLSGKHSATLQLMGRPFVQQYQPLSTITLNKRTCSIFDRLHRLQNANS